MKHPRLNNLDTQADDYRGCSTEGIPLGYVATALALLSFSEKLKNKLYTHEVNW